MIDKLSERVKQLATENAMLQAHNEVLQIENDSMQKKLDNKKGDDGDESPKSTQRSSPSKEQS